MTTRKHLIQQFVLRENPASVYLLPALSSKQNVNEVKTIADPMNVNYKLWKQSLDDVSNWLNIAILYTPERGGGSYGRQQSLTLHVLNYDLIDSNNFTITTFSVKFAQVVTISLDLWNDSYSSIYSYILFWCILLLFRSKSTLWPCSRQWRTVLTADFATPLTCCTWHLVASRPGFLNTSRVARGTLLPHDRDSLTFHVLHVALYCPTSGVP